MPIALDLSEDRAIDTLRFCLSLISAPAANSQVARPPVARDGSALGYILSTS